MSLQDDILQKLDQSLISEKVKTFWRGRLNQLNETQKKELLSILKTEDDLVQDALNKQTNPATKQQRYKKLLVDMKKLARTMKRDFMHQAEESDQAEEKDQLDALDNELNNL